MLLYSVATIFHGTFFIDSLCAVARLGFPVLNFEVRLVARVSVAVSGNYVQLVTGVG